MVTYLPSLYGANELMHEGYESYPIDNLFGAICGVFAIIGGGIGSGIICSDKLTDMENPIYSHAHCTVLLFLSC